MARDRILRPLGGEDPEALSRAFHDLGWRRQASTFERYLQEQAAGDRWTRAVEVGGRIAGYVTMVWAATDPVFGTASIPEIMDLNVLPPFRRRGLGSALLDAAEATAATRADRVGLRVGLHSGFGAAQRLYVRRGYLPDGSGAIRNGDVIPEGASIELDDDVTLRMIKDLSARPARDP